jgi:hypothetical protein
MRSLLERRRRQDDAHSKEAPRPPVIIPWEPEAPADMFRQPRVENGRLVVDTTQGRMTLELVALPPTEGSVPKFLKRKRTFREILRRTPKHEPQTKPLTIQPPIPYEQFDSEQHAPAMGQIPFAVLEPGMRYGIRITVPTALVEQEWGPVQRSTIQDDFFEKVEYVHRQKHGAGVTAKTDDGNPLVGTQGITVFKEQLFGGFVPSGDGFSTLVVDGRLTLPSDNKTHSVGETYKQKGKKEALIFTVSKTQGLEAAEKDKGIVRVVVYDVVDDEISEVIRTRKKIVDSLDYSDNVPKGPVTMRGGYDAGETSFGGPVTQKVSTTIVADSSPVAAFKLTLVAQRKQAGLEMTEAPELAA